MTSSDASGPATARLTPYELVFGPATFEAERFPAIQEEAQAREVDASDPGRFVFLSSVGELLRAIAGGAPGERAERESEAPSASDAVEQHGRLLYHAWHFWRHGRQLLALDRALVRRLASGDVGGADAATAPHPAGYAQLPRHLVWGRAAPSAPAEPLDGFFWVVPEPADASAGEARGLELLAVLGLRADRPGLTVVPVSEPGLEPGGDATAPRPDGVPFGNILPGGELDALLGVETPAELLTLARRLFRHIAERPESISAERTAGPAEPAPHRLPPSALPFRVVVDG